VSLDVAPDECADLYYRRPPKALVYRHFEGIGAALRFVRDSLTRVQMLSSVLQVGERRFEGNEVVALVDRLEPHTQSAH
jgi:hypothetical protein